MRRSLTLRSILPLLLLALGTGCPRAADDSATGDDDDSTAADDDDSSSADDDDSSAADDDDGADDDDASESCSRVEGLVDMPANPPGGIVPGPLLVAVFDPSEVAPEGVPIGAPIDLVEVTGEPFPYMFSICSRAGAVVVTSIYDTNDGELCTVGDLWTSTTGDVPDGGVADVGTLILSETVVQGDCRDGGDAQN